MSFNRNKVEDIKNTEQVISGNISISKNFGKKNWLDHSRACEKIDEMLIRGAAFAKLLTSGRKESAVKAHLQHLKSDHGLAISNIDGVYKFNLLPQDSLDKEVSIKLPTIKKKYLEPTIEDFKAAAQLLFEKNNKKEISFDEIFDYLEQDFSKKGQQLKLSWRTRIEDEINKNRGS